MAEAERQLCLGTWLADGCNTVCGVGSRMSKIYTSFITNDGQWLVRFFDGEKFITEPIIYYSIEDASNAVNLLTARNRERNESELVSQKSAPR